MGASAFLKYNFLHLHYARLRFVSLRALDLRLSSLMAVLCGSYNQVRSGRLLWLVSRHLVTFHYVFGLSFDVWVRHGCLGPAPPLSRSYRGGRPFPYNRRLRLSMVVRSRLRPDTLSMREVATYLPTYNTNTIRIQYK